MRIEVEVMIGYIILQGQYSFHATEELRTFHWIRNMGLEVYTRQKQISKVDVILKSKGFEWIIIMRIDWSRLKYKSIQAYTGKDKAPSRNQSSECSPNKRQGNILTYAEEFPNVCQGIRIARGIFFKSK